MGIEEIARQICSSVGLCEPVPPNPPPATPGGMCAVPAGFNGPSAGTRLQALQGTQTQQQTPVNTARTTLEVRGDPRIGTLTFVRQYHPVDRNLPAAEMRAIADYQVEILRYLEAERPSDVFAEGYCEDILAGDPSRSRSGDGAEFRIRRARELFPNGIPADLNETQRNFLIQPDTDAVFVYIALHDEASLHRTVSTCERHAEVEDHIVAARTPSERDYWRFTVREQEGLTQAINFFRVPANRGKRIAYVFGGDHSIARWFPNPQLSPQVFSVEFPRNPILPAFENH